MFTGIIETSGTVIRIQEDGSNKIFTVDSAFTRELKEDQSVAHNGVCLTVTGFTQDGYQVTAIAETLRKTNLGLLNPGDQINLERCMIMNGRIDGHIVQGHVDQTAVCSKVKDENGSWMFHFSYDVSSGHLTVPKGSVCVNGVSLTVVDAQPGTFSVAIIPYTYEHTNFRFINEGSVVNIEFDIIGKYVQAYLSR